MKTDKYGQNIYSQNDLCGMLMADPNKKLDGILVEELFEFDDELEVLNIPEFIRHTHSDMSVEEFDRKNQTKWFMPKEYYDLDIAAWVLSQCKSDAELQRAGEELLLYHDRDMFDMLRYMKYLVDIMRSKNIIWGVGRGSSVASFVLYLIGVHRINSLYYDLSVEEFFK